MLDIFQINEILFQYDVKTSCRKSQVHLDTGVEIALISAPGFPFILPPTTTNDRGSVLKQKVQQVLLPYTKYYCIRYRFQKFSCKKAVDQLMWS
jgi:hypothetical protein